MKIVMWIGNEPNQKALANKINEIYPLSGIITESRKSVRKYTIKLIVEKIIEKIFLRQIGNSWRGMLDYYNQSYPNYPNTKIIDVENINSDIAYNFTMDLEPDLVLVSGTRLIKEKMLSIKPSIGILNLHTGLSPYIKGGPNCTNWCIATKQFHLIGNTIMWIDLGIDSGNILTTEFTELRGNESLLQLHINVMEHAHSIYLKSIKYLEEEKLQSVSQNEIGKGSIYYTKEWTLKQKVLLVLNYPKFMTFCKSNQL